MPRAPYMSALLFALAIPAWAQQPPKLEPLPEPPPPPPGMELDQAAEPQVTITKKGEDTHDGPEPTPLRARHVSSRPTSWPRPTRTPAT